MSRRTATTLRLIACLGAVLACAAWIDRPAAEFMQARVFGTRLFVAAMDSLLAVQVLGILIAVYLVACGGWSLAGRRLHDRARAPLRAAVAAAVALVVAESLKIAIGRSQVYPAYLVDHLYRLRPFTTDHRFGGFPSATMAIAGAFLGALGIHRVVAGAALLLLAGSIAVTNGHWIGDLLGGTCLGASIGAMVVRRRDR